MEIINTYRKLVRANQWVKNTFLFIPIFFAGELFELSKLFHVFIGFISFCFASSLIYIVNDIRDVEFDKLHPEKSKRPIASGIISKSRAITISVVLGILSILSSYGLERNFLIVLIIYILINLFYSFGLKRISILDILIVASGFVLRAIGGGFLADVPISQWLVIMIFLLSLFLVIAKRREDILEFLESGKIVRKSVEKYNLEFINSVLTMLCGVIIVSYIMYSISPQVAGQFDASYLYLTSVFVIAGLTRYLQITFVENKSGSPVKVLYSDRFIHITLVLWIISFFIILYGTNI